MLNGHFPRNFARMPFTRIISHFGRVDSSEWEGMTSSSSLTEKLTIQNRSSEQPSSKVDMVKGAAVDSAEGQGATAECCGADGHTCSNG